VKLEKRICDDLVKELIEDAKNNLVLEISPREFSKRTEDVAYDFMYENMDEEEFDLIVECAEKLALRKLRKDTEITFFESESLYKISSIKDYGGIVNVPGDYTKFWDEKNGNFRKDSPIVFENAQVVEIDKKGVLFVRKNKFKLQLEDLVII
jgi:hypothetical protein